MRHNPGVFIDIDGVVLKGGKPFEWSIPAINVKKHALIRFIYSISNDWLIKKGALGKRSTVCVCHKRHLFVQDSFGTAQRDL